MPSNRGPKIGRESKEVSNSSGARSSAVLNAVLTQIYHLKRDNAMRFTKKNDRVMPFESAGEASLEFLSQIDCSLFVSWEECLIITFYDLVEVGVENFKTMKSFSYDEKIAPRMGSKPFFALIGEGFESSGELKHLKEVLLDLSGERVFQRPLIDFMHLIVQVVDNLNLAGVGRALCVPISLQTPIELVEVGPSMDLVVRRHRLPNASLQKEAMKGAHIVHGKLGKIYVPDQKVGNLALFNDVKELKRERREAKARGGASPDHPQRGRWPPLDLDMATMIGKMKKGASEVVGIEIISQLCSSRVILASRTEFSRFPFYGSYDRLIKSEGDFICYPNGCGSFMG
ncbi:unnamed protein product [Spirodela intermedia]|uniref:Ribosome production factor 2 homolog n=1 Tax=Spirodela intermedia TaxID=51605 RepID=A0ABN7E7Z3_SPIIN|nr:unnamed protein product [Spirodela intermedia]